MSTSVYLLTIGLLPATILVVFGMKYASAAFQARARLTSDGAYKELAERALALQSATDAALAAVNGKLAAMGDRLASIEKILKDVE